MDEMLKDERFAHIAKDPKFRRIPKSERKVKIDKRFRSMFVDKKFTVKYTIDKRGRPVNQSSTENLKKYYDLSSSDDEQDEEDKREESADLKAKKKKKKAKKVAEKSTEENDRESQTLGEDGKSENSEISSDEDKDEELNENERQLFDERKNESKKITKEVKQKLRDLTVDYARGEGALFSDSSSDDTTSDDDNDDESEIEHAWGELDKEAETTDEITHRLALCNMDWDRIRAVDIFVLINSFLPASGTLKSVAIYPSDYGRQRMAEEEVKGPIELVEASKKREDNEEDENEEGSEYHLEKMRQYQLNRLKYYYAILDFDTAETANKIYAECDGIEYESTSTRLDLRFIPDDMEFENESTDFCEKLPEPTKYQPRQFTTTALQQVKVQLTWDDMNQSRQDMLTKINSGKLNEVDENDMRAYFASGTSDEESVKDEPTKVAEDESSASEGESKKNSIEKYKSLLKTIEKDEEDKKKSKIDLELTWEVGQKEKSEKLIKERMKKNESATPFEQYLEKRRAKKKAKREEREKLRGKDVDDSSTAESDDSVPSDVDMNDPYFAEELKNEKTTSKKKSGKSKKNIDANLVDDEEETRRKAELELLLLDKDDEEGKRHFNIKKIEEEATSSKSKKKRLMKKRKNDKETTIDDDFQVDVADPRFAAIYSSHHYNIDPADPHYRKTKGTEALVMEKLKRRTHTNNKEDPPSKQSKKDEKMSTDLAALVKSVKRNTKNIMKPIK